jgi:hypothetical protein
VNVVRLDGVIGPAMARYLLRALDRTARENAQAVFIEKLRGARPADRTRLHWCGRGFSRFLED